MNVVSIYSLLFLILTIGARYYSRPFVARSMWNIFFTAILGMIVILTLISSLQYETWLLGDATQFLLPPHQSSFYFLQYISWRFWAPYFISLFSSFMIGFFAHWYNKRHGNDLLDEEEPLLIALAIFLVGYPGWILYGLVIIALALYILIVRALFRLFDKFSLYDFWLPIAAFVILIMRWLATTQWFLLLKP